MVLRVPPKAPRLDSEGPPTASSGRSAPAVGWRLKACPRCHGDLWRSTRGEDWECLACGWCGPTSVGTLPDAPTGHPRMTLLLGDLDLIEDWQRRPILAVFDVTLPAQIAASGVCQLTEAAMVKDDRLVGSAVALQEHEHDRPLVLNVGDPHGRPLHRSLVAVQGASIPPAMGAGKGPGRRRTRGSLTANLTATPTASGEKWRTFTENRGAFRIYSGR